jgi:S-formylglutathione hydrolase FrmB
MYGVMKTLIAAALLLAWLLPAPAGARAPARARLQPETPPPTTKLRFEVTAAPALLSEPKDGRLFVMVNRRDRPEPRMWAGEASPNAPLLLGKDAPRFGPGVTALVDQEAATYPLEHLAQLKPGEYYVQAVFAWNRDLWDVNAPGNLYSEAVHVRLDPAAGGILRLELTKALPAEEQPEETTHLRFLKIRSELLSRFHGRPIYLRAGILLPHGYENEPGRRYPLRVQIGGFSSRYTAIRRLAAAGSEFRKLWEAEDTPRMILLHLDGAGPFGDPYQVNSANSGPYGDAVTTELIPEVERRFRGIGKPSARVLAGHSTGGWVSLALQVFYPDFFNGCWSSSPDPVDFRAFQVVNLYHDPCAYLDTEGKERPSARNSDGSTRFSIRNECRMENALGLGDSWTMSGGQWGCWNATYSPRGADGRPLPVWDPKTGAIDPAVAAQWEPYDLRLVLERNWKTLGPKLRGKIHISVGELDDYYLNHAVHLLDAFLSKATPPYGGTIHYGPGKSHGWTYLDEKSRLREMAARVEPRMRTDGRR